MPLYEMNKDTFKEVSPVSFSSVNVLERGDLQRLLRDNISVVCPDAMIIDEEFCQWDDSNRRIDLLALDKNDASLIVIELKRTEDGGYMELQSIRYAAMISMMRWDQVVDIYANYLKKRGAEKDAKTEILEFLGWPEPNEETFGQDVRIVLVSADFSKELTTTVMWLNQRDMDIKCVQIKPYKHNNSILVDVKQIIPLPEANDYLTKIKQKEQAERTSRMSDRDYTRYTVTINDRVYSKQPKRKAVLLIIKHLCSIGIDPEQIRELIPTKQRCLWKVVNGEVDSAEFCNISLNTGNFDKIRYFIEEDNLIYFNKKTYVLTNQWGTETAEAISSILSRYPDKDIKCEKDDER